MILIEMYTKGGNRVIQRYAKSKDDISEEIIRMKYLGKLYYGVCNVYFNIKD